MLNPYLCVIAGGITFLIFIIFWLGDKLSKERQRNAKLESELEQTKQRYQVSELEQAHQSIESLTNALQEGKQRNANLDRKLKDSNQQKATLESDLAKTKDDSASAKLEVPGCSAYRTLLDAIYSERGIETDVAGQKKCPQELRDASEKLWAEFFKKPVISPDYSKLDYQEAYLLCYFLPYSQPVPYLLNHLILKKGFPCQLPKDGDFTVSFFGCGPGPELFGLMRYLGQSSIKNIKAAMLDIEPWEHGRKIVEHLLGRVWHPGHYEISEFKSDLVGDATTFLPDDSGDWVSKSDLIVMQHCLNEKDNAKQAQLMKNMKQLVEKMKPGAVMLIVERAKYKSVQNFRDKLFIELRAKGNVDIEKDIAGFNGVEINPILDVIPTELANDFFMEIQTNAVNSVKFIWMAISKK